MSRSAIHTTRYNLSLPEALKGAVEKQAEIEMVSTAAIIRKALRSYLAQTTSLSA